jgi:hypothetical protein
VDYVIIFERLAEKIGLPFAALMIVSWGVWQLLKPIVANINESTKTLTGLTAMLAEHNQRAIDMHETCKTHGDYLCDAKDMLQTNRETIMLKLGEIHSDVRQIKEVR